MRLAIDVTQPHNISVPQTRLDKKSFYNTDGYQMHLASADRPVVSPFQGERLLYLTFHIFPFFRMGENGRFMIRVIPSEQFLSGNDEIRKSENLGLKLRAQISRFLNS